MTYADLNGIYPNYQLPRGTLGWEPSTRTVNGGPGWAPKPTRCRNLPEHKTSRENSKRYFGVVEGWVTPKLAAATGGYAGYCTRLA